MNYWKRPLFALVVLVAATIACAEPAPTRLVSEVVRDGHSRVVVSQKPIPTPIIPLYIAPAIPVMPVVVPVNSEPLHTLKHAADVPNSIKIVDAWQTIGYRGLHFLDSVDKQIHVLRVAGNWCVVVVSKTTKLVITAYSTGQTPDQIIQMLIKRGFSQIF